MEMRKIIAFGKSTYSITLPKKWVTDSGLKKGDLVSVAVRGGKIEVSPGPVSGEVPPRRISISLEAKPIKEVEREFIAAYIKGYDIIELAGSHEGKVSELRRRLHNLVAVEVMEVDKDRITAHVFADSSQISLSKIISRAEVITRTIFQEVQGFTSNRKNLELRYREIMEKKLEIDRQTLFAVRTLVSCLGTGHAHDENPVRLFFTWHLLEYLEKISDYLLNIAFDLASTDVMKSLGKKGKDDLDSLFSQVRMTCESAIRSYNKSSVPMANDVFDTNRKNSKSLYEFIYAYHSRWIPSIANNLRQISSKSRDIAKATINANTG